MKSSILATFVGAATAVELTGKNFDELTFGKAVFLKFFSPGCHHCQKVAPAWETMRAEFENHENVLIGEIDCAGTGKSLCNALIIDGFPSFKYGDPIALQDFEGTSYVITSTNY